MTEFSGTLEGVGLPAIVRFLAGLEKTGCLRITHQDWGGEIYFEAGAIVSATLGSRKGLSALDALVQALPGASFLFDTDTRWAEEPTIHLTQDAVLAHLDELVAHGGPGLPSLDAVPRLVPQDDDAAAEETVPLDRGTVQTLLAVDGVRTVREIIAARGSFEALWQVANLAEVGLVRLPAAAATTSSAAEVTLPPTPASREGKPAEPKPAEPKAVEPTPIEPQAVEPKAVEPKPVPTRPVESTAPPANGVRDAATSAVAATSAASTSAVHCPKLGFEDDPANSFGRPTRLHRCFAAGTPLPLSLDQQRELCLSEQYGTCPRLAMAGLAPSPATPAAPTNPGPPAAAPTEPAPTDDPRIVRLPVGGRGPSANSRSVASADTPTIVAARPRPTAAPTRDNNANQPTPLRGRPVRAAASAAVVEPGTRSEVPADTVPPSKPPVTSPSDSTSGRRPRFTLPIAPATLAAGAMVLLAIAVVAVLLAPHMGDLFTDETGVDMSNLPNANAALEGTPVTELGAAARPTAVAPAAAVPQVAGVAATIAPAASGSTTVAAAQATAQAPTVEPTPAPTVAPTGPRTLLEETFDTNERNWPNNQQGPAWITGGSLRIMPRQATQFVAIGIPAVGEILQDVEVNATFRKVGGPAGGGYGIIVRDQGPAPRDGINQLGRYYVLEVGDKGEVGIWRREGDRWIDLLPWQRSDAVKGGSAANDLTVRAIGDRLSLSVNGTEVGSRTDGTLAVGNVGIFVGGDGNSVALDQLSVKTP
jgi:hypothetical protein